MESNVLRGCHCIFDPLPPTPSTVECELVSFFCKTDLVKRREKEKGNFLKNEIFCFFPMCSKLRNFYNLLKIFKDQK